MRATYPATIEIIRPLLVLNVMATASSEPLSQRLAAIREQLKLLADYL
jgi:hypothetical protein